MDSLSLRLCPPAAHPATTSSRSVLYTCFFFFSLLLVLAILECPFFSFSFFLGLGVLFCFCFCYFLVGWTIVVSIFFFSSLLLAFQCFTGYQASCVFVCFFLVCLLWVFFVDFSSVGSSALAKW